METRKNSLIKTAAIVFLLSIFWSASAFAQPNITSFSGSLTDGSTITINGNSFGANGPNIVIFDDFESGANGNNISSGAGTATIGKWDRIGQAACSPKYDNTFSVSGTKAFKADYTIKTSTGTDAGCSAFIDNLNTAYAFLSYWIYLPTTSAFPCYNGGICNWKPAWLYGTNTQDDDQVIPAGFGGTTESLAEWAIFGNDTYPYPWPWNYFTFSMNKGNWYRIWAYIHATNDATGTKELWLMSTNASIPVTKKLDYSNMQIFNDNDSQFETFSFSAWARWCNNCAESAPRFDDVYLAIGPNARARVEIGNSATYNTCTNLTIATVTSWSDTSITATIRQGSFSNLNNIYLYVIDADGNVNENGYLLSDGSGNTTPPASSGSGGDSSASGGSGCGIIKKPNDKSTGSGLKAIDIGIASLLLLMLFYKLRKLYKINFWIVFVFFIITITIAINVEAATLEVGAGKTYSTIQAAANAANAGDTILVFPGTYNERVTLSSGKTGTAENKIIFKSQTSRAAFMNGFDTGNANYLRIEGFDISYNLGGWYGGGIWINNSSYVDIVDNYFHDIPGQAINPNWSLGVTHNNIYVANNKIYRVNQGIIARGNDWLVENNDIERLVGTFYDADYTRFFGENITFRNNYFHGTFQNEIGTSHTDGFQTFAVNSGEYAKNIIIEGNVVRDFYHQGIMLEGKTGTHDNLIVRNNIFADAASWGIAAHGIANLQVLNNNFVNMLIHGVGFRAANDGTPTTGVVQNNIFYNGGTNYWKEATCTGCTLTGGYNIITIEKYPYYKESTDLIGVDPLFVNISGYDFHLQSGSPAKDKGIALTGFATDKNGISRPQGSAWDIGAYEYCASGSCTGGSGNDGDTGDNTGSSGGDSGGGSSGGSGCGFVKEDGKGQGAKGEGLAFAMLIISLAGIALRRIIFGLKM